jgi:hypothetical protein
MPPEDPKTMSVFKTHPVRARHAWFGAWGLVASWTALSLGASLTPPQRIGVVFEQDRGPLSGGSSAVLWSGFEHEWLRRELGFRVPHRISRFSSRVTELSESHVEAKVAQSTGVDGDYMKPVLLHQRIESPGISTERGTLHLRFEDFIDLGASDASAQTVASGTFEIERRSPEEPLQQSVALLQGFELETRCVPKPGLPECNSNGIWPHVFEISLGDCTDSGQTRVRCSYRVQIARAWTPARGGLPPFEIKPLNASTEYDLKIGVLLLSASGSHARFSRFESHEKRASAHQNLAGSRTRLLLDGEPLSETGLSLPQATVGLHSLRFELSPRKRAQEGSFLGRYIGGLGLGATPLRYEPALGDLEIELHRALLLPRTVHDAGIEWSTGLTLIQLGHPGSKLEDLTRNSFSLCAPSSSQAPAFSRWDRCAALGLPERTEVIEPLQRETR